LLLFASEDAKPDRRCALSLKRLRPWRNQDIE
jgi:hypothetical protein